MLRTQIFVNLPVKDLKASVAFFTELGFTFNPKFTDDNATCMEIGENIFAMLLLEKFFQTFTRKPVADATTATEAIIALSVDSRESVDELVDKALAAGASTPNDPQDHGFMYVRSFGDPDGHHWEIFHMDESAQPPHE